MRDGDDADILPLRTTSPAAWLRPACAALRLHDHIVAGDVIAIGVGVNEKPDRSIRETADGREQPLPLTGSAGVDDERAFLADLHGDVRAGADDHVHVALDRKDLETVDDERRGRPGLAAPS